MKKERSSLTIHSLLQAAQTLAAVCMILIVTGCGGGTSAVQVPGSGWLAHRYGLFDTVRASTDNSQPTQMQKLDNIWKNLIEDGYITTDSSGQGEISKNTCNAYIFQSGSGSAKQEYISACPKGVCTISLKNCSGITVVTLPANITFKGTYVTIIVDNSMETAMVMALEGVAIVTPSDQGFPPFDVGPGQGSYAVTANFRDQASGFFGFAPGELRDLGQFVVPIENLGQNQQIQSANLIAISHGIPIIPIPTPYTLDFRWLDEKYGDIRVAEAIVRGVNLNPFLDQQFAGIPVFFSTQGQRIDVRSLGFDPDRSNQLFREAGFQTGQEMILAFDDSVPGTRDLAAFIADGMKNSGWILFKLQGVNLFQNENAVNELGSSGLPVLFIGGS